MKYIKEYYKFNNGYIVKSYEDNFDDPDACVFSLTIEDTYGNTREYELEYELFLNFIQEIDPNLKSYLVNREELDDFESIFGNLEELGFSYKTYLQKYVDEYVDPDVIEELDKEEKEIEQELLDELGDVEDISDDENYGDDDDDDGDDGEWWKPKD